MAQSRRRLAETEIETLLNESDDDLGSIDPDDDDDAGVLDDTIVGNVEFGASDFLYWIPDP